MKCKLKPPKDFCKICRMHPQVCECCEHVEPNVEILDWYKTLLGHTGAIVLHDGIIEKVPFYRLFDVQR